MLKGKLKKTILTVILPYYKISFLRETLLSLEAQTCKDFELFIGNDASPNDPEKLISEILQTTAFSYKKYESNFGSKSLVQQWNRIMKDSELSGWFMILGDDDVLLPDFVEEFYRSLPEIEKNHCNAVKYRAKMIDENSRDLGVFSKFRKLIDPTEYFSTKILKGSRSSLSEHIFRTSVFQKYGFKEFPLAWESDNCALLEVSEKKPIYFISTSGVLVRSSNENISGRKDNMELKSKASIMFQKHIINNLSDRISSEALSYLIDLQIYYNYHKGHPLNVNLAKHYLRQRNFRKLLTLPKTLVLLWWKNKNFSK